MCAPKVKTPAPTAPNAPPPPPAAVADQLTIPKPKKTDTAMAREGRSSLVIQRSVGGVGGAGLSIGAS